MATETYRIHPRPKETWISSDSILTALSILLADGNGRGVGDLGSENPMVGHWAGDRQKD